MPPAETTVLDVVLNRLDQIHESVHQLRNELNSYVGQIHQLIEWKANQERLATERKVTLDSHETRLALHDQTASELKGAMKALRWAGAAIVALFGAVETFLHTGGGK